MRKTTLRAVALALAGALALAACGDAPDDEADDTADETEDETDDTEDEGDDGEDEDDDAEEDDGEEEAMPGEGYRACMITDQGGVDDGSFNETAFNGLLQAEEELGVDIDYLESSSETDFEPNMQTFVQQDCDLIVSVGFLLAEVTNEAADANPDQKFAIVDEANPEGYDNLLGLKFETSQAAFLAGYAAADFTETGTIGTYGGINIPTVSIFMDGYLAGAEYYNEQNDADVEVLGWDGEDGQFTGDFESLDEGRAVTENLLDNGADIIMPVAGPVGGGSAAAMEDRGEGLLIWVDTDGYESTDFGELMFTSVMKQMDVAVFEAIERVVNDEFEGGEYLGTLENEGVDIAPFHDYEDEVSDELKEELEEIRQGIIDGDIAYEPEG
ncbi:MAG: BMP family protein [Nitriliruptoraceae bacterium]